MARALERYFEILEGDAKARYLDAKDWLVSARLSDDTAALWRIHEAALSKGSARQDREDNVSLLDLKIELAHRMLDSCEICERRCGVNRNKGTKGHCGVLEPMISSEFLHMGEEPDLVPSYTIFFSGCTFNCVFCQNWDISTRPDAGNHMDTTSLARRIDRVAGSRHDSVPPRARNVNWVGGDPTSNLPSILDTLRECTANIPQVWNSNMYLTERAMTLLDGVIDVYLTDFKYGNDSCALRLSNAPDYMRIVTRNHLLARAQCEVIVRHLIIPGHIDCCTRPVLTWISDNLDDVKVNVMAQYRPEHKARGVPEIARPISLKEYQEALDIADGLGLDLCD